MFYWLFWLIGNIKLLAKSVAELVERCVCPESQLKLPHSFCYECWRDPGPYALMHTMQLTPWIIIIHRSKKLVLIKHGFCALSGKIRFIFLVLTRIMPQTRNLPTFVEKKNNSLLDGERGNSTEMNLCSEFYILVYFMAPKISLFLFWWYRPSFLT